MERKTRRRLEWLLLVPILIYLGMNSFEGYKDIDKRFFVVGIGVDEGEEEEYSVTLKLAVAGADPKQSQSDFVLVSQEAATIGKAVQLVKATVDKELDFGHTKAIVFGRSIIENRDMRDVLDWFIRRRDIQKIAFVAASATSSKDVLAVRPKSERMPSNAFFLTFGTLGTESPYIITEYLFVLRRTLHEAGVHSVLPLIDVRQEGKDSLLQSRRVVVLKEGEGKLILGPKRTKYYTMLDRKISKIGIEAPYEGKTLFLNVADVAVSYDVVASERGAPLRLVVKGQLRALLEESRKQVSEDEMDAIERAVAKTVNKNIKELLELLQENRVDPLGFGLRYRVKYDDFNRDTWPQKYANAEIDANVKVHLLGIGFEK
ncbi:Ger(x)C family spore germination protein [Paenibacillus sp. TRM 82003]|nr:Ger(x)C family spore germination protein [Paenibacillus sp. TRM 82003]